ncbi:hypothetical protein ABEX25_23340 [Paenibacillus thiaminolyticus]|uniref:hypothetical protein n=1 Tax=Paenibacillus thiaminolyticus TaxID=49283 RepID=UPI003D266901
MAKTIDISGKLTNERPKLKLAEDKVFEIDHRKNTVLLLNQKIDGSDLNDLNQLDAVLEIILGKEAVEEIGKMDLSFADYQTIFIAAMAGAFEEDFETVEARFRRARETV